MVPKAKVGRGMTGGAGQPRPSPLITWQTKGILPRQRHQTLCSRRLSGHSHMLGPRSSHSQRRLRKLRAKRPNWKSRPSFSANLWGCAGCRGTSERLRYAPPRKSDRSRRMCCARNAPRSAVPGTRCTGYNGSNSHNETIAARRRRCSLI